MLSVIRHWWASADRLPTVGPTSNTTGMLEAPQDILRVFRIREGEGPANHE